MQTSVNMKNEAFGECVLLHQKLSPGSTLSRPKLKQIWHRPFSKAWLPMAVYETENSGGDEQREERRGRLSSRCHFWNRHWDMRSHTVPRNSPIRDCEMRRSQTSQFSFLKWLGKKWHWHCCRVNLRFQDPKSRLTSRETFKDTSHLGVRGERIHDDIPFI